MKGWHPRPPGWHPRTPPIKVGAISLSGKPTNNTENSLANIHIQGQGQGEQNDRVNGRYRKGTFTLLRRRLRIAIKKGLHTFSEALGQHLFGALVSVERPLFEGFEFGGTGSDARFAARLHPEASRTVALRTRQWNVTRR